jgi:signal transduction histidine kinase/ActR/RegA family two-component response regulator
MSLQTSKKIEDTDRNFRRLINRLALFLSISIAILTPALYLQDGLSYEQKYAETKGKNAASEIEFLITSNPEMWSFLVERIDNILLPNANVEEGEVSNFITVHSIDGTVITQYGSPLGWPKITVEYNIRDVGKIVGKVNLSISVAHVWRQTFTVFLIALVFGLAIYFVLRIFPLRALDRSVHERNEAQSALLRLNEDLEEKVASRTRSLKETLDLAEQANTAKSEFLSSMSHELRTPMNAILGFGQMLAFNPKEPLTEDQKKSTDHILKSGQYLLTLIEDILDFSMIEAGELAVSIEDLNLQETLNNSFDLVDALATDKGIEIKMPQSSESNYRVKADGQRLCQCLVNLLTNSIKYNEQNGTVHVNIQELTDGRLRISVIDFGFGIASEKQPDVFQPFSRLGFENSDISGSGIGLSITKQLIEKMGGTIGFESTLGIGSTFWIEIFGEPIAPTETAKTDAAEQITQSPTAIEKSVLYVEDNPANLSLMEMIIARMPSVRLISARNAEIGIERARVEEPDLILMDINLPGMSGIDALGVLGDMEETSHIPIIAISTGATKKEIDLAMKVGFRDYLTKPIDIQTTLELIGKNLELE